MTHLNHSWSRERILKVSLLSAVGLGLLLLVIALSQVFIPVGIALLIAYIMNPVISFMDRHHSRRVFTVSLVYVVFLVLVLGSGFFLAPALLNQGQDLISFVKEKSQEYGLSEQLLTEPAPFKKTEEKMGWWESIFNDDKDNTVDPNADTQNSSLNDATPSESHTPTAPPYAMGNIFKRFGSFIKNKIPLLAMGSIKAIFNGAGTVANFLMQFVLTLFYAFFFLLHFPQIRDTISGWIPHSQDENVQNLFHDIDDVVAGFFRGRLLVCFISAFVMSIGLLLSGIPYWLLLGIAAGFLGIIPFIGVAMSLIPSLIIALNSEHMLFSLIGVLVTFGIVQGIVEPFVGPFVISQKVSLHPVTIVIVLMVGAALFGVMGLFLAIPIFGVLKLLTQRFLTPTLQSVINE